MASRWSRTRRQGEFTQAGKGNENSGEVGTLPYRGRQGGWEDAYGGRGRRRGACSKAHRRMRGVGAAERAAPTRMPPRCAGRSMHSELLNKSALTLLDQPHCPVALKSAKVSRPNVSIKTAREPSRFSPPELARHTTRRRPPPPSRPTRLLRAASAAAPRARRSALCPPAAAAAATTVPPLRRRPQPAATSGRRGNARWRRRDRQPHGGSTRRAPPAAPPFRSTGRVADQPGGGRARTAATPRRQ